MPNFKVEDRPADVAPPKGPYRVPKDECFYMSVPHRFVATLKGNMTKKELLDPGTWDLCELRPWDEIAVTFGVSPQEAKPVLVLRVIATPKSGLRGFERKAGLIERKHTIVAIVSEGREPVTIWGDERATNIDESKRA
jgi:hypothetical protein